MKYNKLFKILTLLLTIILIVSLSVFNIYISVYYSVPNPDLIYHIKPYYPLGIIGILVIIQYICIYKTYYKNKW